jgi:hypothetical protein
MTALRILTVAEDNNQSDRITAKLNYDDFRHINSVSINLSISNTKILTIKSELGVINIKDFDRKMIGDLIKYLEEAREFLSEEEMVAKLMGRRL